MLRGVGEASIRRAGPWPPRKRLASAIRARHGRHGKLTLYRDAAGAEPVSSMATGSEEDYTVCFRDDRYVYSKMQQKTKGIYADCLSSKS